MTEQEWLAQAQDALPRLKELLRNFHPANQTPGQQFNQRAAHHLRITAPGAERACEHVRRAIRADHDGSDPCVRLEDALQRRDVNATMNVLNAAWFGVPESTACWTITGFREAVALLEDPPEADGGHDDTKRV